MLVVGDGMSLSTVAAARVYKGQTEAGPLETKMYNVPLFKNSLYTNQPICWNIFRLHSLWFSRKYFPAPSRIFESDTYGPKELENSQNTVASLMKTAKPCEELYVMFTPQLGKLETDGSTALT